MAAKELNYWPGTTQLTKPAKEVADMLGVKRCTLFRWVRAGKIECVRVGRTSIFFTFEQVQKYIELQSERTELNF